MKNYLRLLAFLKGLFIEKDPRFAGQSAWLKAEMLDKAAGKRRMREDKRIKESKEAKWRAEFPGADKRFKEAGA